MLLWKVEVARANRPSLSLITEANLPKKMKKREKFHMGGGRKKKNPTSHSGMLIYEGLSSTS